MAVPIDRPLAREAANALEPVGGEGDRGLHRLGIAAGVGLVGETQPGGRKDRVKHRHPGDADAAFADHKLMGDIGAAEPGLGLDPQALEDELVRLLEAYLAALPAAR